MKKYRICIPVIILAVLLSACSTIRHVEPMDQGEHRAGLSLGGPLFDNLGFPIPIPNIAVDYQYGLLDNFSLGGAVYITPLIFNLFGMIELDVAYTVFRQNGAVPNIVVGGTFYFLSDFLEFSSGL